MFSNTHTIITKTPMRVSVLGGGPDREDFIRNADVPLIGFSINYFTYFNLKKLLPIFPYKSRFVYSEIEEVMSNSEIKHSYLNKILDYFCIQEGVEIVHTSDAPTKLGLGSSSSFISGLVKAVTRYRGPDIDESEAFKITVDIEQNILKENVGLQDAFFCNHYGLRKVIFSYGSPGRIKYTTSRLFVPDPSEYLVLYYTGHQRISSEIASSYKMNSSHAALLKSFVESGEIAMFNNNHKEIGRLLDESWGVKKSLSPKTTCEKLDEFYSYIKSIGCYGAKLLGAGGGGCFLISVDPEMKSFVDMKLSLIGLRKIPYSIFNG